VIEPRWLWSVLLFTAVWASACHPGGAPPSAVSSNATTESRTAALQVPPSVDTVLTTQPVATLPLPSPTERPTATPIPPLPSRDQLAAMLTGQQIRFCRDRGIAFDGTVEQAFLLDHEPDGVRVDLIVSAANVGVLPSGTFQLTELQDERGRRFDQAGLDENIDGLAVARTYGVEFNGRPIDPGFTARNVWTFVVAPDVRELALVGNRDFPCGPEPAAAAAADLAPAAPAAVAATLVGQSLSFCPGHPPSVDLAVERADAKTAQGGLLVTVVVQATNLGPRPGGTYLLTELMDERGRRYPQAGLDRGLDLRALAQPFGATPPQNLIPAGQTARQLWAFLVASDVHSLTVVKRELFANCAQ